MCPEPTRDRSDAVFIKRVVGLPGDEITIEHGNTVINGKVASEDFIRPCRACNFPSPVTIPPDHYFTLGDNRPASDDSRYWGPVPVEWIEGRVEE